MTVPPYGPWYGWEIFPIIGLVFMAIMLFFMFGPSGPFGSRRSGWGPGDGLNGQDGSGSGTASVLEILKRRYASGEITKEQYEEMRRDLLA